MSRPAVDGDLFVQAKRVLDGRQAAIRSFSKMCVRVSSEKSPKGHPTKALN